MKERKWPAVPSKPLLQNGGSFGKIVVQSTLGFRVRQAVILKSNTKGPERFEVKYVESDTVLYVGPLRNKDNKHLINLDSRSDISGYLVADGATIEAIEQDRAWPPANDIPRAVYASSPSVAIRTLNVDYWGEPISKDNPLPIDGTFSASIDKPNAIEIVNTTSPATADTEFNVVLPANTVRVKVRARKPSKLKMAFSSGQTATNYFTIMPGNIFDTEELDLGFLSVLYFSASKPNIDLELLCYTN